MREMMEKKYGKKCMIEAAGIRFIPIEKRRKIKGYKKTQDELTYHHILEQSKGGKTTEENGAILKGYNHEWLHKLSEENKQLVNRRLQQYKLTIAPMTVISNGVKIQCNQVDIDFSETIDIPVETYHDKEKFNRAKEKARTQREVDEYFMSIDDDL